MVSSSSIGGLVSGLDTKTLVDQLISVASQPQALLKTNLSTTNARLSVAQGINTKIASLTSLAKDLASTTTFTTAAATSSSTGATATVTGTPVATSLTFQVEQLASAYSIATGPLTYSSGDITVTGPGGSKTVTPTGSTPAELAAAINGAGVGITARTFNDGNADRLIITADETGAGSAFSVDGVYDAGTEVLLADASDAKVSLGGGALPVYSSTNTFSHLIDGVDITLSSDVAKNAPITVSTAVSATSISDRTTKLVAAMNSILNDVALATKAPAAGVTASATTGGLLTGESTFRGVTRGLLDTVSASVGADAAVSAGLSVSRDGQVTFDAATFKSLYASDPDQAQRVLTAFATAVQTAGSQASDSTTGSVSAFIQGGKDSVKTLTTRIADWDDRLAAKRDQLTAQYAALETALQRLKSQSDSLTQALASLSGSSSS